MGKEGKREIWTILGKFGQVWASLGKFGQVWASLGKLGQGNKLEKLGEKVERIRKGNKNLSGEKKKKKEEKEEEKVRSRIRRRLSAN